MNFTSHIQTKRWMLPVSTMAMVVCVLFFDIACRWDFSKISVGGLGYIVIRTFEHLLFLVGVTVALGRWSRLLVIPVLLWSSLICPINCYMRMHHGFDLCGDTVMVLLGSSWDETWGYVKEAMSPLVVLGCVGVALLLAGLTVSLIKVTSFRFTLKRCCSGCLISLSALVFIGDFSAKAFKMAVSYDFVYDGIKILGVYADMKHTAAKPEIPSGLSLACTNAVGVFVIGESATRNSWSLYGYERATTPGLDVMRDELFVYKDVLAPWSHTHSALRLIMSEASLDDADAPTRCFLPQICRAAGYHCVFISAQNHWGGVDISGDYIFNSCHEKKRISDDVGVQHYDTDLLPYVEKQIDSAKGSVLIFLHVYGNHFECRNRYPAEKKFFGKTGRCTRMDEYDNATRLSCEVVAQIISHLSQCGRPAFLLYLSDHGETPRAENWRDQGNADCWEVPMFFWMSNEYGGKNPQLAARMRAALGKPLQADQLLDGWVEMLGVKGYCRKKGFNFLDRDFKSRNPRLVGNGKVAYERDK